MNDLAIKKTVMVDATTGIYPVQKSHQCKLEVLDDCVAEEVPIALIYNGISHAVMLATPKDLKEFAFGFSLSEGILTSAKELYDIEIVHQEKGIELHLDVSTERFQLLKEHRRSMAGRTGCGLCGAESLEQALRIPETFIESTLKFDSNAIYKALQAIQAKQELQILTGATHASAWVSLGGEVMMVREDVGRHNALDKLIGAMALSGLSKEGFVLTTSRASYEMVQKVVTAGIPMLVAISAPTGLAIRIAQGCGLTLIGFARSHQHVIYSRADRILYKNT